MIVAITRGVGDGLADPATAGPKFPVVTSVKRAHN